MGNISNQTSISQNESPGKEDSKSREEELAEMRRASMRMALARRLKHTIAEDSAKALEDSQDDQQRGGASNTLQHLEKIEQKVDQLREDNRKREYILNKQLERQQAQIARNVRMSAANLADDD
jgi:hypothetical protein